MLIKRTLLLLALVSAAGACERGDRAVGDGGATPGSTLEGHGAERPRDLTGDGVEERIAIAVEPAGPADAMPANVRSPDERLFVRLAVIGSSSDTLYAARWPVNAYFHYGYPADSTPAGLRREVHRQLDRLLADSAFLPRTTDARGNRVPVDREAIDADVLEAPGAGPSGWSRARRVAALVEELRGRPTYTYFAGGEETYTIAWSDRERRFVKVFACC
jgi:hypothetical protein